MKKYIYFTVSIACLAVFAGFASVALAAPRTESANANGRATLADTENTKGGLGHTYLGITGKKSPLIVRPMQMTAERYYYAGPDTYTWRFTINMAVQAVGETVYLSDQTTAVPAVGQNLARLLEDGDVITAGVTVGTYADIPVSAHGNYVVHDGDVEHVSVTIEYTESHMLPDVAYKAVLKHLKYNTDDSDTYKVKSLNSDFQTEEIYID